MESKQTPEPSGASAPLAEVDALPVACNRALIVGELVTEPDWRTLPGGTEIFAFGLTVRQADAQTTSVPLIWYDPPRRVRQWKLGMRIAATGPVVRRFYRAGGVTASRTEVTVEQAEVVSRAGARRVIDRTAAEVEICAKALE
ncbi:MAG: hypothetical protein AAF436_19005 [Myxococcota bacterium]